MTSISKTPYGELNQFLQQMHGAGMTYEDIGRINRQPYLAERMVAALKGALRNTQPDWYVSPEEQLAMVKELAKQYGRLDFSELESLAVPNVFFPKTDTEVLMLAVYLRPKGPRSGLDRTFQHLWKLILPPSGYEKTRWGQEDRWDGTLHQLPGHNYRAGVRWVAFDPVAHHGIGVEVAPRVDTSERQLASVEVMMAMLLFPKWAGQWDGIHSPFPFMAGIKMLSRELVGVPYLNRMDESKELALCLPWNGTATSQWSLPTVRQLVYKS